MKKECFWNDPGYEASPALSHDERAEYLIVGGGIGGLLAAHFLLEDGVRNIVLIEKNTVGSGSTGHSAGMLVAEIETGTWSAIAEAYGVEGARLYWQAQQRALETVRALVSSGGLACEFDEGEFLFLAHSRYEKDFIVSEKNIRAAIGAENTVLAGLEARNEFGSAYFSQLERLEKAVSVNPLKLAHEIARGLRARGVRIYENTPLAGLTGGKAATPGGSVYFDRCIQALGSAETGGRMRNFLTTICVTRPLAAPELEHMRLADHDLFLDMEKRSYHYGKITSDQRLLVGYGDAADSGKGAPALHEPHVRNIRRFIARVFGFSLPIDYAWTGRYALVPDLLPLLSDEPPVIRFGGAGTQLATIAMASHAVARMLGNAHPLDPLFKPIQRP